MKISICFLLIIILTCCKRSESGYVLNGERFIRYTGVSLDEYNGFSLSKEDRIESKPGFLAVASYYGISLIYLNGEVWIPEKELKDWDMLYNIDVKSKDSVWIATHLNSR